MEQRKRSAVGDISINNTAGIGLAPNRYRKFIEIDFQYSRIIPIFTYRDKTYLEMCPIVEKH